MIQNGLVDAVCTQHICFTRSQDLSCHLEVYLGLDFHGGIRCEDISCSYSHSHNKAS